MNKQTERGFSLVELLVAVVVGSIIMVGIYSAFMGSINIFSSQQEISQMQFNAKAVVNFMKEKFANTGSGIPTDQSFKKAPISPIAFLNDASGINATSYLTGTDAIQVRSYWNTGGDVDIKTYPPGGNGTIDFDDPYVDNTSTDSLLLLWDPDDATQYALVKITGVDSSSSPPSPSSSATVSSDGLSIYNNSYADLNANYSGKKAILIDKKGISTTFFVDPKGVLRMADGYYNLSNPSDPNNNKPALPLLDNVEDFQIQIGYDTDADNIVDKWSWSYDPVSNTPNINQALVLRCYLLVRSAQAGRFVTNVPRPDIDPDDGISYTDAPTNVRRKLYSFTVQLRNRLNLLN